MIKAPKGMPGLPEGSKPGGRCERVTSLMDIYPTILDLCGLPKRTDLDGHSLIPLLKNPQAEWNYPAITTYDFGEFSIRTDDWRYIKYIDDNEELYDHRSDPEEWHNLANNPDHKEIKAEMAALIPKNPAPLLESTLIKLMPHHIPPIRSKEDYLNRKKSQ